MSAPPILVEDLRKSFQVGFAGRRKVDALQGISLQVSQGKAFGFLGPNGAGKTTTIKTVVGLIFPTSGKVEVFGARPESADSRLRLGYLPENPSFPDHLTGREVLQFSCELARVPARDREARIQRVLELVNMAHAANLQVRRYSKGMTQRLGIAQALVNEPELVILDEPMSGLDPVGRRDIKDLIISLRKKGQTVFFSTHIIADVEEICDEVAILVGGKVVRSGKVASLLGAETRDFEVVATHVPRDFPNAAVLDEGGPVTFDAPNEEAARELMQRLWASGAQVLSMKTRRYGLEKIFLEEVAKQPALKRVEE